MSGFYEARILNTIGTHVASLVDRYADEQGARIGLLGEMFKQERTLYYAITYSGNWKPVLIHQGGFG
jgi:hypothetical protein